VAITSPDDLVNAVANAAVATMMQYRSIANQLASGWSDLWLYQDLPTYMVAGTDTPGTSAAYLTKATKGSLRNFTNPTAPAEHYLASITAVASATGHHLYLVDRLAHVGGLNATTLTAQTVGIDLRISSANVSAARIGASDYSDIRWAMEIYTDIGTTARNLSINYRNAAETDGQTQTFTNGIGGASPANRAGRLFPLAITGGCSQLNNCTLSASTGTAGNFGFVAYRPLAHINVGPANSGVCADWTRTLLATIPDDACLSFVMFSANATTGLMNITPVLIQG
jgi:hypothetical protein